MVLLLLALSANGAGFTRVSRDGVTTAIQPATDALEELRDVQNAAKAIGQELLVVPATSDRDFEAALPRSSSTAPGCF
jgi:hypothetical protein